MELTGNGVKFSSGREEYANYGIFGLTRDLQLTEGYDSFVFYDEDIPLTPAEKIELAEFMIARWKVWAAIP